MEKATPSSFGWKPMVSPQSFAFSLKLTPENYELASRGSIPQEMEDKWFVFMEKNTLNFHRSWTGLGVFQLIFEEKDGFHEVIEAYICEEFNKTWSDEQKINELNSLLKYILNIYV